MNGMMQAAVESCPGCGLKLPPTEGATHAYVLSSPGCWALYSEVLAREYSDPAYMAVHRLTVDAYAVQHPGVPERRSIQSVNVHLVGLHLVLDRGADGAFARHVIGAMTQKLTDRLTWLDPPADHAALTVRDVIEARDAADHGKRVRDWAAAVWASWRPHHSRVSALADEAIRRM
ncbi:MAG: hypothetical protein JOZ90_03245 [Alphaproteobacteria bacterium]|nr:hypothetical protein [Alphaproteobacteria bacterium]MBV9370825.1 hypothetical protein [Alphaproteobacteria bacterium]MBV9900095.1 hypothetical protein [Alphaproteobacteria bacterium]